MLEDHIQFVCNQALDLSLQLGWHWVLNIPAPRYPHGAQYLSSGLFQKYTVQSDISRRHWTGKIPSLVWQHAEMALQAKGAAEDKHAEGALDVLGQTAQWPLARRIWAAWWGGAGVGDQSGWEHGELQNVCKAQERLFQFPGTHMGTEWEGEGRLRKKWPFTYVRPYFSQF